MIVYVIKWMDCRDDQPDGVDWMPWKYQFYRESQHKEATLKVGQIIQEIADAGGQEYVDLYPPDAIHKLEFNNLDELVDQLNTLNNLK